MRFDTPVYFQSVQAGAYDPTTGDYGPDVQAEDMRRASVTDSSAQTLQLVYGALQKGSLTLRLQRHYTKPFDRIRIGDKTYRVDIARRLRRMQTLVVSEVP